MPQQTAERATLLASGQGKDSSHQGGDVESGVRYQSYTGDLSKHVRPSGHGHDDADHAHAPGGLRRKFSDMNLLDSDTLEDVEEHRWKHFMYKDFLSNLTVVTLPAIFTNAIWRAMNLGGIAVHVSPAMVIVLTTLYIAPVVWATCTVIDFIRQLVVLRGRIDEYFASNGLRSSICLGFKFFMGVVGWTVGYEVVAGTHMFYAGPDATASAIVAHAIGAAIGEFFGLLVACEMVHIAEFLITGHMPTPQPTASVGVATKGTLEGFVWSVIGDLDVATRLGGSLAACAFDSILLGVLAAVAFTVMGFATSLAGYAFIHRRIHPTHQRF